MRTIRTIKSGSKEKEEYYTNDESLKKDEYYSEAEMESAEYKVTTAQWMGPKAASLGLTGDVEQAKFKQLFYGYLPGTSQRIRGDRKHGQENLAVDCTLSAPKSFSMHALTDLRLYGVHMEACRRTQAELDQRYGYQRKFIDGKQVNIMGDGLIVAAIPHWTSREGDMMLHTHLVIFNGVQGPDGKWRAFDDRQFSYAEWAGSFYRNELAKLTQQTGYQIREVALPDGGYSFEIEGISRSEIEHFSKRSMQIAQAAEVKGVERNAVVLTTRKAKRISKTWQEFRDDLSQEMEHRGVELQTPSNQPIENPIGRTDAAAEIDSAIRHLSERSVSFKREDLFKYALDHIQRLEMSEIDIAIDSHPELIQGQDKKFTTVDALSREIRTIQTWEKGKGNANPVLNEVAALNALESLREVGLNQGQAEAIVGVLSATDRHLIIHGLAGVGKTTALRQLKHLIEENGSTLTIRGYSPTIKAAKHLGAEIGIETNTVEHLVLKTSKGTQNELWIIDEAGMASARQMEAVLSKADEIGARILLVGDTNQNHSIEAGSPMKSLMNHGVTAFKIHEIIRQKDENQKRAVELASSGHGAEALSLLCEHGWVKEIEDCNARAQAAAQEWLSLSPEDRDDTLIVTGTNAERLRINECLRWGLREEGNLGEDHTFKQLVSRQFTDEEKSRAENYSKGDYIRLNWQYKTTPLQKDKLYQVVGKKEGQLLVETEGGRLYWFDPSKYKDKEVFYEQDIALAVGDRLRWRITNKPEGQINGTEFTVKAIDGNRLAVMDEKGQEQVINGSKPLGLDYALVWTAHGSQGLSKKRVIVSATSGPTSAREPFYVKISRQKKHIVVFANNLKDLRKWVSRSAAQDNPLELIGDDYGPRTDEPDNGPVSNIKPEHSGVEGGEPGTQGIDEQRHEHSADRSEGRDGRFPDQVRGATGEQETVGNGGRDSGIERNPEGIQGQTDELGTDAWRDEFSGELRSRRDPKLHPKVAQQRLDESATDLRSRIERVVSSLNVLNDDDLVHDSGVEQSTREVVEALEPIVSGLEAQSKPVPPKRDLSAAMARAINALSAVDSEQVFSESGIIDEIKSLVSRVEAHTLAQEQLTNLGEHYGNVNSSSESSRTTSRSRRDSGVEYDERESGIEPDGRDSGIERLGTDIDHPSEAATLIGRGNGNEGDDRELARGVREAHQSSTQTSRRQERDFSGIKAEPGNRPGTARDRQVEHRHVDSEFSLTRGEYRSDKTTNPIHRREQERNLASDLFSRATGGLPALADAIVRVRLQRELAEPLAQLKSTLTEISEVNRLNERLKAELAQKRSALATEQAILQGEQKNITATKTALLAKLQEHLAQAKVEVLDTTLTEWRSLRQEADPIQLTDLEIAPSEVAELTELLENYPAQKAIQYAMEEYSYASNQVIDLDASLKTGVPVFKPDELLAGSLSNKSKVVDRPVTQTIDRPQKQRPITVEQLNVIRAITRPEKTTKRPSIIPKPVKHEAPFWTPDYSTAQQPDHIEPKHWQEMTQSAIHPDLIVANVRSLEGETVFDRLLSEKLAAMGTGQYVTQPMARLMAQYETLTEGGWWGTAGIDATSLENLAPGAQPRLSDWGTFKGDNPRIDSEKTRRKGETQFIKYEHPAGTGRHLYLINVPDPFAQKLYDKHKVQPTEADKKSGFWYVVKAHPEIPINLGEGLKKTLSATSQGDVQIGSSGVNGFYRARDSQGNKLPERVLSEELAVFAVPGRVFRFTFDQDAKASTVQNVRRDMVRTIELLETRGCIPLVVQWNTEQGKGLDDLIANQGPQAYAKVIRNAQPAEREKRIHYRTEYNALVRAIHKNKPHLSGEALDIEVYLRAIAKGDLLDGDRILSQSDQARILKDPEKIKAYIEHIKAIAPAYVQQKRELAKAQAAKQAVKQATSKEVTPQTAPETKESRDERNRDIYNKIADELATRFEPIEPKHLNAAIYQIAKAQGLDYDAIIRQSPDIRSLKDEMAEKYIRRTARLAERLVLEPKVAKPEVVIAETTQIQQQIERKVPRIKKSRRF